jgi:hypothetical protein
MNQNLGLKIAVSAGAAAVIVARIIWPALIIDAVTLGLLLIALLPWLSGIIKSAEFPGGWKVEFQDVKKAGEKVVGDVEIALPVKQQPSLLAVVPQDPNLALVGLRIEIEKKVRALAQKNALEDSAPLSKLLRDMRARGIITSSSASGIQELVLAGTRAAHGAIVESPVSDWAINQGPTVLASLETKMTG